MESIIASTALCIASYADALYYADNCTMVKNIKNFYLVTNQKVVKLMLQLSS